MRHALLILPLLLLAACSPKPPDAAATNPEPAPALTPDPAPATGKCDGAAGQSFIGQVATDDVVAQIRAATGSTSSRVLAPDTMATMDFLEERVNVHVDASNVITQVACG